MIENTGRYTRNSDFIFRKVVDEMILVPIHQDVGEMDSIYTLNPVGAFIWENLDNPKTLEELKSAILEEYEAPSEVVAADLVNFLNALIEFGAVTKNG